MSNDELIAQFQRCEQWQDADQWDLLAMAYFNCGYVLNAGVCFTRADACRLQSALVVVAVETGGQLNG
jgi:hypothetical protein